MTDGPFKNLKLGSCWKRLAEAVQNEAASSVECGAFASDALARHLVTKEHSKAIQEIDAHLARGQLELDPLVSVEAIFDRCEKAPFLDAFQKELLFRTANDTPLAEAVAPALDAAIAIRNLSAENHLLAEAEGEQRGGERDPDRDHHGRLGAPQGVHRPHEAGNRHPSDGDEDYEERHQPYTGDEQRLSRRIAPAGQRREERDEEDRDHVLDDEDPEDDVANRPLDPLLGEGAGDDRRARDGHHRARDERLHRRPAEERRRW